MPADNTDNSTNNNDGENNVQGIRDSEDGQGHENDETNAELNYRIEFNPEKKK